ncbi:MAG: hypothetical protein NTW21_38475 [Verrucomicrobia bacterium]|nr:hypothetical protein [Verrucomicrobiota bacterium]
MQITTTTIAGIGILWLGTLAGAYYLGDRHTPGKDGHGASGSVLTTGLSGGVDPGHNGGERLKSGTREAAAKALTVKQILAKMKATMRGGSMQNPSSMMKVMGLMDKIRPEDLQAALAEAEAMTDPQQKMLLTMCLLAKWAETDGPTAMKYAEEHSASGPLGQMAKMSVASAWAEKDAEAVWQWYKGQGDKDSGGMFGHNMALVSLFSNIAGNDPDLAFKRLEEIDAPARQMALAGMFQAALFDDDKRQQILMKVDALPDESERKQARQMMLSQWAMLAPEQAVEWVKKQPWEEQRDLRESMGMMLMMNDPKKGASLVMDGVPDDEKPREYSRVISQWAAMDANAAGTWLNEQPQGPQLDEARQSFVSATSQNDPANAMTWAGTITNPDLRFSATMTAYQEWKKKDLAAADQALASSGLDEAQVQAVKAGQTAPDKATAEP